MSSTIVQLDRVDKIEVVLSFPAKLKMYTAEEDGADVSCRFLVIQSAMLYTPSVPISQTPRHEARLELKRAFQLAHP